MHSDFDCCPDRTHPATTRTLGARPVRAPTPSSDIRTARGRLREQRKSGNGVSRACRWGITNVTEHGTIRTATAFAFLLDLEAALVDEVERLDGVAAFDDTRDVDLVRALAYHLDVHVALPEGGEHAPGNADHIPHRPSDEREDGHVADDGHLVREIKELGADMRSRRSQTHRAALLEFAYDAVKLLFVKVLLNGHTDIDLARADEVHDDAVAVKRPKNIGEETV